MKIEQETLENHQVKLRVEADPEQLQEAKQRAARQIARQTKIPGFRPGKAPYHMVERMVGEPAILEEAIHLLVEDVYPKAIQEAGIKPYGPGRLEEMPSTDPPTFEFVIPLEAEVELGAYKDLRVEYELEPVKEEDVDRVLMNLRNNQAVIEPVERPAQEADMVQILLSGERSNPAEGQPSTLIQERSVPIVIETEDADTSMEWPFPGFSRNLIGLSAGDTKEIKYTFPEDSPFDMLQSQEVIYRVQVESVKSRTLPELNDELAVSMGEYANLEELRTEIHDRLEKQESDEYNEIYDDRVVNELIEASTIKFPPDMLDDEQQAVLRQFENRLAQQNMDLETYLKTRQMDREAFIEELRPVAEKRLKRFLVLFKLAGTEEIRVESEEIQQETARTLEYLTRSMKPQEAKRAATQELISNLASNITTDIVLSKSMDRLRQIAKGEYVEGQPEAGDTASAVRVTEEADETNKPESVSETQPMEEVSEAQEVEEASEAQALEEVSEPQENETVAGEPETDQKIEESESAEDSESQSQTE